MPYSAPLTHSLHIPRTHVALYPRAHIYDSSLIHRHNDIEGQGAKQKALPFAPSPWIAGQEPSMESRIDRQIGRRRNGHSDSPSMNIPIPQESSYNVRPHHLCKVTRTNIPRALSPSRYVRCTAPDMFDTEILIWTIIPSVSMLRTRFPCTSRHIIISLLTQYYNRGKES